MEAPDATRRRSYHKFVEHVYTLLALYYSQNVGEVASLEKKIASEEQLVEQNSWSAITWFKSENEA